MAVVTLAIIAINVLISLLAWQAFKSNTADASSYLFEPYRVARGENYMGALLSNFSHASMGHIFFNMLTFYFFGPSVEQTLGGAGLIIVYIVSGVAAAGVGFLMHRNNPDYRSLGASGSVTGVLFATILLNPHISIYLMFIPIPIPGPVFAVLYIVASYFFMKQGAGSVCHEAHIAGGIGGLLITLVLSPYGFDPLLQWIGSFV